MLSNTWLSSSLLFFSSTFFLEAWCLCLQYISIHLQKLHQGTSKLLMAHLSLTFYVGFSWRTQVLSWLTNAGHLPEAFRAQISKWQMRLVRFWLKDGNKNYIKQMDPPKLFWLWAEFRAAAPWSFSQEHQIKHSSRDVWNPETFIPKIPILWICWGISEQSRSLSASRTHRIDCRYYWLRALNMKS